MCYESKSAPPPKMISYKPHIMLFSVKYKVQVFNMICTAFNLLCLHFTSEFVSKILTPMFATCMLCTCM